MNNILKRNNEFDLDEFYKKSYNGAIIIITPNQVIKNILPNEEHHRVYLGRIYNLIYGSTFDNNDIILDAKNNLYGNNIIMMLDKFYTLMYMPYKINSYQLQEFLKIYNEYQNIKLKNITFGTFNDKIWDESCDMRKTLEYLNSIVDDNVKSTDKNIIDLDEKVR